MKRKTSPIFSLEKPWNKNKNAIWLASSITFRRNIDKFLFPSKLSTNKLKEAMDFINKALEKNDVLKEPLFLAADKLSPIERQYIHEHYLTPQPFLQTLAGEGFVVDKNGKFLATINMGDHLHLRVIDTSENIEMLWEELMNLEVSIGKALPFAFSNYFGYLTSDLSQCGTAMNVEIFLQLPALMYTGKINGILEKHLKGNAKALGLYGRPNEFIGNLVILNNQYTIGKTEEAILSTMHAVANKLVVDEKNERGKLKENPTPEIIDAINRAYGALLHSYQIDPIEAMEEISLLKLGIELGWIEGISLEQLNILFMYSRKAHLLSSLPVDFPEEQIPHKRSEFIHEALKKAVLKT